VIYVFEHYSLDSDRRELRRGAETLPVAPQIFDVLEYLIRNRDRVVTNDDLIAAVWSGRIVSESTLSSCISAVRQVVGDSGEQQCLIRTMPRKGYRFIAQVRENSVADDELDATARNPVGLTSGTTSGHPKQAVTFCRTKDGINLAVASVGHGPSLLRVAHFGTNIEYDVENPLTGPLLQRLAVRFRLTRYDGRGGGLSDRNVAEISLTTFVGDLETVVDSLALERFVLLGMHGAAAVSIAYAVRHPHRVRKLVLYGGYAQGHDRQGSAGAAEARKALLNALRSGWDPGEGAVFLRAFSSLWLPSGTAEQVRWLTDLIRVSHSGEQSEKWGVAVRNIDVVDLLPKVEAPTIVFHCIRDHLVPFDEGRRLACSIPNARFVPLDSDNHALLSDEPAWAKFVGETEAFLADEN